MPHARDAELVRVNVFLSEAERTAFDQWARYAGTPKLSMQAAARELIRLAAAGKVTIDRDGAAKRNRNVVPPPPRKPR